MAFPLLLLDDSCNISKCALVCFVTYPQRAKDEPERVRSAHVKNLASVYVVRWWGTCERTNERGERTMEICISKYGAVTLCMFVDAKQRCNGHRVDDTL